MATFVFLAPVLAGGRKVSSGAAASSAASSIRERENVADQIEVLGSHVDWHPGAGNPNGPDLVWVTAHLRNRSKTTIGVVWADVHVLNASGQEIAGTTKEIVFYPEGKRKPLAPGGTWKGDSEYLGESYLPTLDSQIQSKQPVTVKIEVTHAYRNKDTGTEGQSLDTE